MKIIRFLIDKAISFKYLQIEFLHIDVFVLYDLINKNNFVFALKTSDSSSYESSTIWDIFMCNKKKKRLKIIELRHDAS